jgi:hypothetical protein
MEIGLCDIVACGLDRGGVDVDAGQFELRVEPRGGAEQLTDIASEVKQAGRRMIYPS